MMAIDSSWTWPEEPTKLYVLLIVFLSLGVVTWLATSPKTDPSEPPILHPTIPVIGHLLGLAIHKADYLQMLSAKTSHPIFTLRIFSRRIYVIQSPPLVQSVYRSSKSFSFEPIFIDASRRVLNMTDAHMEIVKRRPASSSPSDGFPLAKETSAIMHSTMSAGASLLAVNACALNRFAKFLDPISSPQTINLYAWLFQSFTIATCEALYGPNNPIELNPSLIASLLDFTSSIGLLYLNLFPSLTASKGYQARKTFAAAFKKYYDAGHDKDAAAFVQGRKRVLTGGGFTTDDLASFDIGIMAAITMNSNPGLFWLLVHIYSDPALLSSIRAEIEHITILKSAPDGQKLAEINVSALNTSCPLLISAWQETLRITDATVSSRVVMRDDLLDNTYLLKKDGVIQMACGPMHTSPSIWGSDARVFNAERFTKASEEKLDKAGRKLRKQGFAPFGGGTMLCPGRHFATTEIMGSAANFILGYEMSRADGKPVGVPRMKKQDLSVQVKQPEKDIEVVIKRREEWDGIKWKFNVGAGAEAQELVFE